MADSPWIVDGTAQNFMQVAVEASHERPVLVDFWAEWCGPCKALGPILEKLAVELDGGFSLVKVDTDREQELAASLQIQSLPTVKLVSKGQLVDEFAGALPEAQVRAFLAHHGVAAGPKEDPALVQAREALMNEDLAGAERLLREGSARLAPETSTEAVAAKGEIDLTLAAVLAEKGDRPGALAVLDGLPPQVAESEKGRALRANLALVEDSADEGELEELRRAATESPADLASRVAYGKALAAAGRHAEALRVLMDTVHEDREFDEQAARKAMLEIFDAVGHDTDLAAEYRRELQMALFV